MGKWLKFRELPWSIWRISKFEIKIAQESRLKLPGITGWLKGGIANERMEKLKREIEGIK